MAVKKAGKKSSKAGSKKGKAHSHKKAMKGSAISKPFSKTEILSEIAEVAELSRKQVAGVFDCLQHLIERHIKKGGAGVFVLPGLLKVQVIHKPATKARKGINPFTGEPTTFKAKPARNVVKVKALKKLKGMV